jgi:hypothetical protein
VAVTSALTPAQHLLAWFTPVRRQLIKCAAVDRLSKRRLGSLARFLAGSEDAKFSRVDLRPYYPVLQLLGYLPPGDVWVPTRALTATETSSDVREWFTPERRELIKFRALDEYSGRAMGVFGRYLSNEEHLTFKIIGIDVYYPTLAQLGFEPLAKDMTNSISTDFSVAVEHLLAWFTPERRSYINSVGFDLAAGQPEGTLSQLLAGYPAGQRRLAPDGLHTYYPHLATLGYRPDLNLEQDESVQRARTAQVALGS